MMFWKSLFVGNDRASDSYIIRNHRDIRSYIFVKLAVSFSFSGENLSGAMPKMK